MAITKIDQVSCSLNLGLIYSLNYTYSPEEGVGMIIAFVNETGTYTHPIKLLKASIIIGSSSFSMIVASSKISLSEGRRVIEVTFVDELHKLDNYLVVLTGKGCGQNVYALGTPVDNRTPEQKQADALDPSAQQIINLTQFPDLEYTFDEFLAALRTKFNVTVTATYNTIVTNAFTGTFREVLTAWCSFFNISFFFENGIIKIFDPTTLFISLPTKPVDAIEWEDEEDARDTYGKTCFNWFQQEGGQYALNQTSDASGPKFVRNDTLFPAGYEFNLPQPNIDLNQVAAAQYGEQFWFLYNYSKGSAGSECGWSPITVSGAAQQSTLQALTSKGYNAVLQDNSIYQGRFEAYQNYGQQIAGRWYLSSENSTIAIDKTFTWFQGDIVNFDEIDNQAMDLTFLTPAEDIVNIIPGTEINQFYSGVNYVGNRIVYRDNAAVSIPNNVGPVEVGKTFESIVTVGGSDSFDFSAFDSLNSGSNTVMAYKPGVNIPPAIQQLINDIPNQLTPFQPRFPDGIRIQGLSSTDYASSQASHNESDSVSIVNSTSGPHVVSNTAVIKTLKQGAYTAYYDKYSQCASSNSADLYFQYRFDARQISTDVAISFAFSKDANNTYTINRDYATLDALVNNPLLVSLAEARSFITRRVSYTLNRFQTVPINFLSNGLVGMTISVAGDGITASYSFSNEVLEVPKYDKQFDLFAQQIRNSWIRHYQPNQVIT